MDINDLYENPLPGGTLLEFHAGAIGVLCSEDAADHIDDNYVVLLFGQHLVDGGYAAPGTIWHISRLGHFTPVEGNQICW